MDRLPLLLYDGDCGFCTWSVRFVERLPVRCAVAPWQEADLAALRTNEDRARHEVLWIEPSGRIFGGSSAVAAVFRNARMPWSLLGRVLSMPLIRTVAEWGYRLVSANRSRLPGTTPACQLPAEQRPGGGKA